MIYTCKHCSTAIQGSLSHNKVKVPDMRDSRRRNGDEVNESTE